MSMKTQKEHNESIRKKMIELTDFRITDCPTNSPWVRPIRMNFKQDGVQKDWDVVRIHDSVSIIVYNETRDKLVFVRQFRPASYYGRLPEERGAVDLKTYPAHLGLTLELCSGIVDKNKPLVEIARDELREECGYEASADAFVRICSFSHFGNSASLQTFYYVAVTDDMHIHPGGGCESENELIEVVEMTTKEAIQYLNSPELRSPPCLSFGIQWFLLNKKLKEM